MTAQQRLSDQDRLVQVFASITAVLGYGLDYKVDPVTGEVLDDEGEGGEFRAHCAREANAMARTALADPAVREEILHPNGSPIVMKVGGSTP